MSEFMLPCPLTTCRGEVRRVGVELEFGGMELRDAAEAVRAAFGGELREEHEHRLVVVNDLGEFEVTYDTALLRERDGAHAVERIGLGEGVKGAAEWLLKQFGGGVLPLEISTPPIPGTRLGQLDGLERELRARHAEGTRAGLFNAFAVHFNAEAVDPADPVHVTRTLRAFLLLYRWLVREGKIDRMRRLLPFVNPFPEEYARLVIDTDYAPDMSKLADDYVKYNPTRNRPLDLLPLLAFNDEGFLKREELAGQKVGPRPAFHYRLPNCMIDEQGWCIADEWDRWVLVERLADDPDRTARFARDYLGWEDSVRGYLGDRWVRHVAEEWVPQLREARPAEQIRPAGQSA